MFQGFINFDTAERVDTSAIQDILFDRGMHWSCGRSGIVDLVAAHKWFNLAAMKGREDALAMRREVAEMMSEVEVAAAQRAARAWLSTH
jgi:TPR repeat protein